MPFELHIDIMYIQHREKIILLKEEGTGLFNQQEDLISSSVFILLKLLSWVIFTRKKNHLSTVE